MGKFIKGIDRSQLVLFTETLEERIPEESSVRVIDLFVECLDLERMGFTKTNPNRKGTNSYDAKDLLKLYLYAYRNKVRSSRNLAKLCKNNIEVMWLIRGITPDFRTIADFRKENVKVLKEVFKELVLMCKNMELIGEEYSQDGVKIEAVNSKERNYTLNKLDDKIKRIDKYLEEMDKIDKEEAEEEQLITLKELEEKIKKKKARKKELEMMRKQLEESHENQISLTDKESKLMKNNGKFSVCYNDQVLVDTKSHIVVNYKADNNSMYEINKEAKEYLEKKITKNITDKGYNDREDMVKCLEEGIIPEVTLAKGQKEYKLEIEYKENEENKKELKDLLKSGVIPEEYKEYMKDIKVEEKEVYKVEEEIIGKELSKEELRDIAMKYKCFTKEIKSGEVYCPEGEILRKKSKNGDGYKYCNKLACKNCKNPCCECEYKEAVFKEGQIIVSRDRKLKEKINGKIKRRKEKIKVVTLKLIPKEEDTKRRKSISEHCHGTMKRNDNAYYFLMKGEENINGELAIYYTMSNLRRIENIIGIKSLIEYLKKKQKERYI